MNIDYLKNYIVICESQNISDAAKKLYIAQPSLSNQITYLENSYNTTLLYRKGRNLKMTEPGELLYQKAKEIIDLYNDSFQEISLLDKGLNQTLNIALPPSIYNELLQNSLKEFIIKHPDIKLNVYETNTENALKLLDEGKCEIAITNAQINQIDAYNYQEIAKEVFRVILPDNAKINDGNIISIHQLEGCRLAIPRAYVNVIQHSFDSEKTIPLIDTITTSSIGAIEIANLKNIYAIIPLLESENELLNDYPVAKLQLDHVDLSRRVIWSKQKMLSNASNLFINSLESK